MKSLFVPWTLAKYLNGAHPLAVSLLDGLVGRVMIVGPQARATADLSEMAEHHVYLVDELQALTSVDRGTIQRFIATRYHLSDALAPSNSIGFHHTILPSLRHGSIVHFETPILFFWPEAMHGQFVRGSSLVDHPFYPLIRAALSHPNIKKIVSHSSTGLRYLRSLFPDSVIQDKTAHVPLFPFVQRSVERARQLPGDWPVLPTIGRRRILFTNSFHGWPYSFWLRGGVTTLLAFQQICEVLPIELIIVGSIPDDLPEAVTAILRSPHVKHVPRASEGELQAYYDSADIMLVPSMGLHSMSIARSICSGCYVICCDTPGVDDLITDRTHGTILNGTVKARVYFNDAKAGLLLDDYALVKQINFENVEPVAQAVLAQLERPSHKRMTAPMWPNTDDVGLLGAVDLFREVCLA